MSQNTMSVVEGLIRDFLLPAMWKGIEMRIMEKRIERHLSRVVSKDMVIDLLDSTTKNSQIINKKTIKGEMKEISEVGKSEQKIKVRTKRSKHIQSAFIKHKDEDHPTNPQSCYPLSQVKRFSSQLIKLPDSTEQQSEEVKSIRVMKQRMRRFQKQVALRGEKNAVNHHQSSRKKKSVHSQCIYHTYDYQANVVEIEQDQMKNFREKQEGQTLLETIKRNLDRQIQEHIAMRKNKEIDDHNRHIHSNVPLNKIQRIDYHPQQAKQQKSQVTFEPSNIDSLSKNFEKYIKNGVQMVTLQDKLVQEPINHEQKRFKIIKERTIHSKVTSPKQKTNVSQSIIYSLENNTKNHSTTIEMNTQQSSLGNKYQSLQLDHSDCISKLSQVYIQNGLSRKKSLLESPCNNPFKLPDIRLRNERKISNKRTSTEQKMIKGLDHIGIKTPINHKKLSQGRNGPYSAFSMNKRTQSSMDECDYQSKDKKQIIKEYFNNYGKQFRLKKQMQGINFYSNR